MFQFRNLIRASSLPGFLSLLFLTPCLAQELGFESIHRDSGGFAQESHWLGLFPEDQWECCFYQKNGTRAFNTSYKGAKHFSEGLAPVFNGSKWGYIDTKGKLVIPFKYDDADPFSEHLAAACEKNSWGYIDQLGEWKIRPTLESASSFHSARAIALDQGKWGFIDTNGTMVVSFKAMQASAAKPYSDGLALLLVDNEQRVQFVDLQGKRVFNPFAYTTCSFSEGLAPVGVFLPQNSKQFDLKRSYSTSKKSGVIDKSGNFIVKPSWDFIGAFKNQLACVAKSFPTKYKRPFSAKWGFIDIRGKVKIPLKFDDAGNFSEGLAAVAVKRKWGFVDTTGKMRVEPRFDEVRKFSQGLAAARAVNAWGYVTKEGRLIQLGADQCGTFHDGFGLVAFRRGKKNTLPQTFAPKHFEPICDSD